MDIYRQHIDSGGSPVRFAYLAPSHYMTNYAPGFKEAKSRGIDVDLFTDKQEALSWLGVE